MDNRFTNSNGEEIEYKIKSASEKKSGDSSAYNRRTQQREQQQQQRQVGRITSQAAADAKKARELEAARQAARRREARRQNRRRSVIRVIAVLTVVIVISASISYVAISCINDILAIHVSSRDNDTKTVTITEGMKTEDVLIALDDAGVIKNVWFCKLAAEFLGYKEDGYVPGTYQFQRRQGLEKMLDRIKNKDINKENTVSITFPEGYTADQIIAELAAKDVCSKESLISAIRTTDYAQDYDFLKKRTDSDKRYYKLEGYLYPDTYDFYIGETPDSVIRKFLNNFDNKWNDTYKKAASELSLTVDQVVILASVVEKEGTSEDMGVIASILRNRVNAGMNLDCDSTTDYINKLTVGQSEAEITKWRDLYDSYQRTYPIGPVCNPGDASINALLYSDATDYYYFIHDASNVFRPAKSLEEHQRNIREYGLAG